MFTKPVSITAPNTPTTTVPSDMYMAAPAAGQRYIAMASVLWPLFHPPTKGIELCPPGHSMEVFEVASVLTRGES